MARSHQQGFFLIEVVIATTVIAVVLIFLVNSINNSVDVSKRSLELTQAAYLLEEGVEASRAVRDKSWDTIATLTAGSPYFLHWSSGAWSFSTTPEMVDSFTRTVTFADTLRDSEDDLAEAGTADPGTRKGTVTVTWQAPSGARTESIDFYITNIK